jgi:DNA-binding transcriptional LysR family regulator
MVEHPWRNVDWDSVRVLLAVAEAGSFRKAADELGIAINTARRIVLRLEDQVGFPLLYRVAEGVSLTPEGRRVIVDARDVEASVNNMWRIASAAASMASGPIRLAITEGLGTFWLIPRLVEFLEGADSRVDLQCAMRSVDVMRLEADFSIQLVRPTNPELIVKRLGYLHLIPFGSREYLERYGRPTTAADLVNHRIVEQQTDQLSGYGLERVFGPELARRMVSLKTNFSSAHYWAVMKGGGLGLLPNYAPLIGGRVDHVDIGLVFRPEIWLSTHPEMLKSPRHKAFHDWLIACFDNAEFPWFGERLMTPPEIGASFDRAKLANYFSGFVAPPLETPPVRPAIGYGG